MFTDIVTYSHFRQFRPGLRIAINSHGGHYWSTQVLLIKRCLHDMSICP